MAAIQARANARFIAQVRAQESQEKANKAARKAAEDDRMKAVRAVQWRTKFRRVENKLILLKNALRYSPEDADLRREVEQLEAMYKALLDEAS